MISTYKSYKQKRLKAYRADFDRTEWNRRKGGQPVRLVVTLGVPTVSGRVAIQERHAAESSNAGSGRSFNGFNETKTNLSEVKRKELHGG